jgi:hypothetical protein
MRRRVLLSIALCALLTAVSAVQVLAQDDDQAPGLPPEVIAAYPEPAVTQLYAQDSILHDRIYHRVYGPIDLFDGPNGGYVRTLAQGYTYVTVHRQADGWTEIGPNLWMRTDQLGERTLPSSFAGVKLLEEPLPYTMAWLLRHIHPSSYPGGEDDPSNPRLLRYSKISIYDEVEIDGFRWYQIGVDKWVHQFNVAKILPVERPEDVESHRWFSLDLYEQVLIAYEGDQPVFATLVSTGLPGYDTNEGVFSVYVRYERAPMSGFEGRSEFYYLQEVPYTMYFDDQIGLHGAYWHDGFGYRQSRGCVNMSITDAHWAFKWAAEEYRENPEAELGVFVYSTGEYR